MMKSHDDDHNIIAKDESHRPIQSSSSSSSRSLSSTKTTPATTDLQTVDRYFTENIESEADIQEKLQKECPELNANFISRILFWSFGSLIATGYKSALEMSDLYQLKPNDKSHDLAELFWNNWHAQSNPSLLRTLHLTFGRRFYLAGLIKLVYDIVQLSSPYFVKLIVDFVTDSKAPMWQGMIYVVLLFILNAAGTLLINNYFHRVMSVGMRLRTALRAAVYRKSLQLSSEARQNMNTGDLVNYMSVDTQKLGDLLSYLHMVWSGVLQLAICLAFLFYFIGISALAGLVVMIVVIPSQGFVARFNQKIRVKMMKFAGDRVKTINEILMGIRVIKFYAWEKSFLKKALDSRNLELQKVKQSLILSTVSSTLLGLSPLLVSVATFALYALLGNQLKASIIFPALSYFNMMRFPLFFLPTIVAMLSESKVSIKRLNDFLNAEDITPVNVSRNTDEPIKIVDGEFAWKTGTSSGASNEKTDLKSKHKKGKGSYAKLKEENNEEPNIDQESGNESPTSAKSTIGTLKNININIQKGSLTAIVGLVGSGKSSLLSAMIGEMKQVGGTLEVTSNISYCPQQAWIQNCTVKENITFGLPFDEKRYRETIKYCALERDLEILPAGDATEIGEKGINLSGGQKQRINLARAVYSNSETYLLDDILSAVDAHVGRYIFDECILKHLDGKTRVLVTHQWQYLKDCDHIIVMKDGMIVESGTYDQLMNGSFAETLRTFTSDVHEDDPTEQELPIEVAEDVKEEKKKEEIKKKPSAGKLIEKEERETGSVKSDVYKKYVQHAGGYIFAVLIILLFALAQGSVMVNSYWLAFWSEETTKPTPPRPMKFYLGIYIGIGVAAGILQLGRELLFAFVGIAAARNLHAKALDNVLHAPTRFFDTTPVGRIISRFSKDTESIDTTIIVSLRQFLSTFSAVIGVLIIIGYVTPIFAIPIIPIMIVYYFVQQYYRSSSQELKRLDSLSRSPVFSHYSETLTGISTIRAYSDQGRFLKENEKKLDANNKAFYCQLCSQRWLSIRLEMIGTVILTTSALLCVVGKVLPGFIRVDGGMAGLALSYALQVTGSLNWLIRAFTETEAAMNSVERVLHYCDEIDQEAAYEIPETQPNEEWPQTGNINFKQVYMKYRPELDYVLKGLDASVYGAEKIGIVGRTGAGKSTLMTVLFRLTELDKGSITIDNVDISNLGLYDLRSRLSIIPQDPVLFSGTVRFNLDPFDNYSDREVWQALERAHIKSLVENLPLQLSDPVAEYGENFSVGQRQLFCLARAILRRTKILVLDEATASVDLETDALIQHTVRTEFADRTVLTIAHRLNTIVDSDRIMVLDHGELVEFDTPRNLLSDDNSRFTALCKQTGKQNFLYLKQVAYGEISLADDLQRQSSAQL